MAKKTKKEYSVVRVDFSEKNAVYYAVTARKDPKHEGSQVKARVLSNSRNVTGWTPSNKLEQFICANPNVSVSVEVVDRYTDRDEAYQFASDSMLYAKAIDELNVLNTNRRLEI